MPFVCNDDEANRGTVVATFPQGTYLGIKAGDVAEVIFPTYPGLVFTAKVADTIDITSSGQIPVGGVIPALTSSGAPPRFATILKLDDAGLRLPAGTRGEGATLLVVHRMLWRQPRGAPVDWTRQNATW